MFLHTSNIKNIERFGKLERPFISNSSRPSTNFLCSIAVSFSLLRGAHSTGTIFTLLAIIGFRVPVFGDHMFCVRTSVLSPFSEPTQFAFICRSSSYRVIQIGRLVNGTLLCCCSWSKHYKGFGCLRRP